MDFLLSPPVSHCNNKEKLFIKVTLRKIVWMVKVINGVLPQLEMCVNLRES